MNVKIIRQYEKINYSVENRKVRIEFIDGSHMVGFINIHSKYSENEREDTDYAYSMETNKAKYKFRRTSDYLKDCNQNEGVITVFNATYGGREDQVCCVFLHSVKFISDEEEKTTEKPVQPDPLEEEPQLEATELSLRERLKKKL
jgi:hypothetical protein